MLGYFPEQALFVFTARRQEDGRTRPVPCGKRQLRYRVCASPASAAGAPSGASEPYTSRSTTLHSEQRSLWQEWLLVTRSFVRSHHPCVTRLPSRQLRLRTSKKLRAEPTNVS